MPVAGYDDSWQVEGGVPAHRALVSETFGFGHRTKSSKDGQCFLEENSIFWRLSFNVGHFFIFGWNSKYSVSNICMYTRQLIESVNLNRTSERPGALDYRRRLHLSSPPPPPRPEKIF